MPLPPARTVRDDLPPTATRCPTCDREGCDQRMVPAVGGPVHDCAAKHRVDWRAQALAAEADAARWREVAPLIDELRRLDCIARESDACHDDDFYDKHNDVWDAITALLAATQEPTP